MRHLKVFRLALDLVKDSVHMIQSEEDPDSKTLMENLFKQLFLFLKIFVINNEKNQEILSSFLQILT